MCGVLKNYFKNYFSELQHNVINSFYNSGDSYYQSNTNKTKTQISMSKVDLDQIIFILNFNMKKRVIDNIIFDV